MNDPGRHTPQTVVILGIPFNDVSFAEAVEWTRQRVVSGRPAYIATANMDFIMQAWRDPELQRILLEADLVVADGIPIVWLSRLMGPGLKGRVTGSDLVPRLAELAAREGFSLFGLGGAPGVAEKAAARLVERYPGLRIAGCYSPPKADILTMNNPEILARLESAAPDILLVAFGAPKQEKWVNLHIRQWRVPVAMGVGGSLDFLAGAQKRAPRFVQTLALEWLWRMLSDPRRLFGRYVANLSFLSTVVFKLLFMRYAPAFSGRRPPATPSELERLARLNARHLAFPPASGAGPWERFVAECITEAQSRVLVMDLGKRPWLNSRELGVLLDLSRISRSAERRLYVLAPHARVERLLRFIRLDRYINLAVTAAEVIQHLEERRDSGVNGSILVGPDRQLAVVLPAELTAANVEAFRIRFNDAWKELEDRHDPGGVTVNASAVEFLDSAALGFLVAVRKRTEQSRVTFRCFGFRAAALRTLELARLESLVTDANPV
jgi:N-acetylglucosaminyldiphosphoundecaprenol N-acetyl-beta-D-mannosaminyltransferase